MSTWFHCTDIQSIQDKRSKQGNAKKKTIWFLFSNERAARLQVSNPLMSHEELKCSENNVVLVLNLTWSTFADILPI